MMHRPRLTLTCFLAFPFLDLQPSSWHSCSGWAIRTPTNNRPAMAGSKGRAECYCAVAGEAYRALKKRAKLRVGEQVRSAAIVAMSHLPMPCEAAQLS